MRRPVRKLEVAALGECAALEHRDDPARIHEGAVGESAVDELDAVAAMFSLANLLWVISCGRGPSHEMTNPAEAGFSNRFSIAC